jgi:acyl carrier protein phosphodiesterase
VNWLAHLLLSHTQNPPHSSLEFEWGNLLADAVKGQARRQMSQAFLQGAKCHFAVDRFTDEHPIAGRSRARLYPHFGKLSGIVVDLLYDHFLARNWGRFHAQTLEQYSMERALEFARVPQNYPEPARKMLEYISSQNIFVSYASVQGIELTLARFSKRVSQRLKQEIHLERVIPLLQETNGELDLALEGDFLQFFPELQDFVLDWVKHNPARVEDL